MVRRCWRRVAAVLLVSPLGLASAHERPHGYVMSLVVEHQGQVLDQPRLWLREGEPGEISVGAVEGREGYRLKLEVSAVSAEIVEIQVELRHREALLTPVLQTRLGEAASVSVGAHTVRMTVQPGVP
ncbi:MAG TPA: hypothetical protein VFV27_09590 [Nevskiaceae bacterium]|nr:hypothetical protein [Nevskiaceae bacterium]